MTHSPTITEAVAAHAYSEQQIEANGGSFRVLDQGSGPAVLFVHGFPDTATTWLSQMQAVADAGYRAVALDMRGVGGSYAPADPNLYTALYTVGDLIGVMDALDIDTAVLVSHDWGADHAQRGMVLRPDRFRAIVSLSIPFLPRGDLSVWDDLRRRGYGDCYYSFDMMKPEIDARIADAGRTIPSVLYWLSGSPPEGTGWDPIDPARNMFRPAPATLPDWADPAYVDHNIAAFDRTGFHGGLNYYRSLQPTFDEMGAFRNVLIEQPSLYIWGGADGLCRFFHPTVPTLEELRETAPGLVGQVRLEGVGHWPQHEARERVSDEIVRFLRGVDAQ